MLALPGTKPHYRILLTPRKRYKVQDMHIEHCFFTEHYVMVYNNLDVSGILRRRNSLLFFVFILKSTVLWFGQIKLESATGVSINF